MTRELQSTLQASGIEWPAFRNHIPWMAHVMMLAVGAFMSSMGVKGHRKSLEAHERDQQFGANESIDIGKSQRPRKEGNARIDKVSAMWPGFAKIIEKVRISRYCEHPETDLHIAENACCNEYTDTWSSKWVHWLSNSLFQHPSTSYHQYQGKLELDTGIAWASLLNTRIHLRMAPKSKIQWFRATLHNPGWMDHCQVHRGSFEAIPILDLLDVEEADSHIASRYQSVQSHVWSHGWSYASFG